MTIHGSVMVHVQPKEEVIYTHNNGNALSIGDVTLFLRYATKAQLQDMQAAVTLALTVK